MSISFSPDHWTICISYKLAKKKKKELTDWRIMKDLTPMEKESRRQKLREWRREMKSKIPTNNGREIYYKSESAAKKAFFDNKLDPKSYEIVKCFFIGL